jgi:hypothetical protein
MKALVLSGMASLLAVAASAQQSSPVRLLNEELQSQLPPKWEAHVRWRDAGLLLATITPWPYQEAFELWYDQPRLIAKLSELCPKSDDQIWSMMQSHQHIVLEPTVGGKTGVGARLSCRKVSETAVGR